MLLKIMLDRGSKSASLGGHRPGLLCDNSEDSRRTLVRTEVRSCKVNGGSVVGMGRTHGYCSL